MPIAVQTVESATVVLLQGQLNSGNATEIQTAVLALIDAGSCHLILDCSMLDYMSSAGLRMVLIVAKRLKREGGAMALCALQPTVREVFEITGLMPLLVVEPDREDALARIRAGTGDAAEGSRQA